MSRTPLLAAQIVTTTVVFAAGCSVYDAELYKKAAAAHDGGHTEAQAVAAADECSNDAPLIETAGEAFLIDTAKLTDGTSATRCLGRVASGHDGYMRVTLEKGDRWHFHVEPMGASMSEQVQDPSLYVRSECSDDRECVRGADACRDDRAEHFSFTAPNTATYFIGVDDYKPGGGLYRLAAYRPVCNDGTREHGEACDPSAPGDTGCSADCRWALQGARVEEREVNDDYAFANAVDFEDPTDRQIEIAGSIAGCPSADHFTFEVEQGASIEAQLLDANGAPCAKDSGLTLLLLDDSGNRVAIGAVQDDLGQCPSIDARAPSSTALAAGRYFIVVDAQSLVDDNTQITYRLALRMP